MRFFGRVSSVFLRFLCVFLGKKRGYARGYGDKIGRRRGGCVKERGGVFESVKKM